MDKKSISLLKELSSLSFWNKKNNLTRSKIQKWTNYYGKKNDINFYSSGFLTKNIIEFDFDHKDFYGKLRFVTVDSDIDVDFTTKVVFKEIIYQLKDKSIKTKDTTKKEKIKKTEDYEFLYWF